MSALSNQIEAGRAYIAIRLDKAQLINGLADVGKRMRAFGASVQSFGSDMFRLSLIGAAPVAAAVNSFIKFDDQMRITGAIAGATKSQLQKLTDQARRLGSTTAFTAQQIASGMTAAARLGNDYAKIRKAIESYMYTTRATGNETWRLGEIAEITGNIMNQYGIQIDDVARVSDILTFASNRSAQTVQDVGQAMRSVGGIANRLGDSIEDTVVSMNLLANRGIKGELLGTAMRKAYDGILSNEKELNKLGVATRDASNELRKPFLIIADIFETLKTKTNAEQVKIAKDIFGLRGMLAGMTLGNSVNEVKQLRTQINQIHGLAKNTAEEMESGIGGAFRKLVSMAQEVGLVIGEVLQTPMTSLMRSATSLLDTIAKFVKENKALVQSFVTLSVVGATAGASIMALGLAIKVVAVPFSSLAGILGAFKVTALTAFNALLIPLNLVGKGIKTLRMAFNALEKTATLTHYSLKAVNGAINLFNSAVNVGINVTRWLSRHIALVQDALRNMGSALGVVKAFCAAWVRAQTVFENLVARGIRVFIVSMRNSYRAIASFIRSINVAKLAVAAYHKIIMALNATKTAFVSVLVAVKTSVIGFVQSISIAKAAAATYHGTIKALDSAKKTLAVTTAMLRGAIVSTSNASKVAMAASLKGLVIAAGAAAAFGVAVYGISKAYPAVQSTAKSALEKMKGWWNENKAAVMDFGKTMYQAIQIGDMEGAFKLALAGIVKVIGNVAPTIVEALSKITVPVLDLWYDMCQKLEEALNRTMEYLEKQWLEIKTLTTKFRMPTTQEYKQIEDMYSKGRSGIAAEYNSKRSGLRDKANGFMEQATAFQQRANSQYAQAMRDVKNLPEMQRVSENLRYLMQNAAQSYRDNAFLGMYAGFKGSRDDAYTNIGNGSLNAKDSAMQKTRLQTRIKEYAQYADKLEESFNRQLKLAQKDRVITDSESEALQKLIDERGYALYMEEELRSKLQAIGETTGEKIQESEEAKKGTPSAAYSVRMLKLSNGFDTPEKRTAKATESLDRNVKWLRDFIPNIIGTVIA